VSDRAELFENAELWTAVARVGEIQPNLAREARGVEKPNSAPSGRDAPSLWSREIARCEMIRITFGLRAPSGLGIVHDCRPALPPAAFVLASN